MHLTHWFRGFAPRLSCAYAQIGRVDEALSLMAQLRDQPLTLNQLIWLSEVCLLSGHVEEANDKARQVLSLAQSHQNRRMEAWALRLLGEIARRGHPLQVDTAEAQFRQALALSKELGMRPLQAHCHHGLGALYRQIEWTERADDELTTAIDMYCTMRMTFWLPEVET